MTNLHTTTIEDARDFSHVLHTHVARSAKRVVWGRAIAIVLSAATTFIAGLFLIAAADAMFVIEPPVIRFACLALLLAGTLSAAAWHASNILRQRNRHLATAEAIDQASGAVGQPVVCGLTLEDAGDDELAIALNRRAQANATAVATSVTPAQVAPRRGLRGPASLLFVSLICWALVAALFPSQFAHVLARVATPWADTPPFTLTRLEPWGFEDVTLGDDIWLRVDPEGRMPGRVDFVRLDHQGGEAERFAMNTLTSRGPVAFSYWLHNVTEPIAFKLEAYGRPTRTFHITPKPATPPAAAQAEGDSLGGEIRFNEQDAARRALNADPDWAPIREGFEQLLAKLAQAIEQGEHANPADAQQLAELLDRLSDLAGDAEALAAAITVLQADLPPDTASLLTPLADALKSMQSQPLSNRSSQDVLVRAESDRRAIADALAKTGLPSDQRTDSVSTTGDSSNNAPTFRDPATKGTYDEQVDSGSDGILPPAIMQQVPPSYRPLINAYFTDRAEHETPSPEAP